MKTQSLIHAVLLTASVFCASYGVGQSNVVFYGTNANSIGVSFVDTNLSVSVKTAIVADLQVCLLEWGKRTELILGADEPDLAGYLNNSTVCPHYPEKVAFPEGVTNTPYGLALQIPKPLSDAYTNAFAFVAANSNIVAAAYDFVAFVSSTNFYGVTSNQIANYVLYNQATPAVYQLGFTDITNALRYPTYYKPSVLGFYHSPDGPAATNLWMFVPGATHPSGGYVEWSSFPAIWHDGKWKFSIWEQNPHYNLPQ